MLLQAPYRERIQHRLLQRCISWFLFCVVCFRISNSRASVESLLRRSTSPRLSTNRIIRYIPKSYILFLQTSPKKLYFINPIY